MEWVRGLLAKIRETASSMGSARPARSLHAPDRAMTRERFLLRVPGDLTMQKTFCLNLTAPEIEGNRVRSSVGD